MVNESSAWRACPLCRGRGIAPKATMIAAGRYRLAACQRCGGCGQLPPQQWADPRSGAGWEGDLPPGIRHDTEKGTRV